MTAEEMTVVHVAGKEEEPAVEAVVEKDREDMKEMGKEDLSNGPNGRTVKEDTDNDYVIVDGNDGVNGDPVESDLEKNGNGIGGEDPGVTNLEIEREVQSESQENRSCIGIVDHDKEPVELCHVVEKKPEDPVDSGPVSAIIVDDDVSESFGGDQNGVSERPEAVCVSDGDASANGVAKQTVPEAARVDSSAKQSDEVSSVPVSDGNGVSLANDNVEDSGVEDSRSKDIEDSEIAAVAEDGGCNGDVLTNNSAKDTISESAFGSGHEQNGVSELPVCDDGVPPGRDDACAKDVVSEAAVVSGSEQNDGIPVSVSDSNVYSVEEAEQNESSNCNGPLSNGEGDTPKQNGLSEISETVHPDVASENELVKDEENLIAKIEVPVGDWSDLEPNSERGFSSEADTGLEEKETVSGSISDECGQALQDDQNTISETETVVIKDSSSEIGETNPSPVTNENGNVIESENSEADTGSVKDTVRGSISDECGEALHDDQNSISETVVIKDSSSEIVETDPSPVTNENKDLTVEFENSEPGTGLVKEKETVCGSISDECGESLQDDQNSISETVVIKDSSSEIVETDRSPVTNENENEDENVAVESPENVTEDVTVGHENIGDIMDDKSSIEVLEMEVEGKFEKVDVQKSQKISPIQFGSVINEDISKDPDPEGVDEKKSFYYLIRVPRYDDENLKEKIKLSQIEVDQKTQSRDAIRIEMHSMRAVCKEYGDKFDAAISQERVARDLLRSKRQEIESIQSIINIDDIGGRIKNMERMIQHETLPLKEEKQLIREIKQLKQVREQLSSHMGMDRQDEVQPDEKDQTEKRLKSLKKEADQLRDNLQKAEAVTKAAKKKYYDETEKLNKVLSEFKAADDIRQEAYARLQSLKKQSYEKNKYFWRYRDDAKAANEFALKRDKEALQSLCINQVERVMDLWNNNEEFRKEYMRFNLRSTLRRLKTLDGRALGPNEEPPAIPHQLAKVHVVSSSTLEERTQEKVVLPKVEKANVKSIVQDQTIIKVEKPKSAPPGSDLTIISTRDEIEEARKEKPESTKEEEELARRAEELRKEEEAAKLREQRRLEEIAKAKDALERKKRNADKAQARALLRAQKEAEQKDKEREKRARKKERRKVATEGLGDLNVTDELEHTLISETPAETPKEIENKDKNVTVTKRSQKSSQFVKAKSSIPPPLRSRGKRRMQPWMWVLLILLVIFALFLVGNSNFFNFGLQGFNF